MDNQNANAFISNANFTEENNLVQLLESSNDFENITDIKLSPYVDIETLKENLYESKSNLSILIGYEPADLTVHPPPPKRSRVGSFFSHRCLVPPKFFPQRKSGFCRRYSH